MLVGWGCKIFVWLRTRIDKAKDNFSCPSLFGMRKNQENYEKPIIQVWLELVYSPFSMYLESISGYWLCSYNFWKALLKSISLFRSTALSFGEDKSWKRAGYAAQNFSLTNKVALNIPDNEKSKKHQSMKVKRHRAGWDNEYVSIA